MVRITPEGNAIAIRFPYSRILVDAAKAIGARFRSENGGPRWVIRTECLPVVKLAFPGAWIDPKISWVASEPANDGLSPPTSPYPWSPARGAM